MQWNWDPVGGLWVTGGLALLLALLPLVAQPRDAALTPGRRRLLVALRLGATLLLLFAWLRPTLVWVRSETQKATLVLLADDSRSMSVADSIDGQSRYAVLRRAVESSADPLALLARKQDVRAYRFSGGFDSMAIDRGRVALPDEPTGEATALGAALERALDDAGDGRLLGIVLLSDGAQRALPPLDASPLAVARRLAAEGTPVFAFPMGQRTTGAREDLAIEDLVASDSAFAGAPFEATVRLRATGFPNQTASVRLLWENPQGAVDPVDAARIELVPGIDSYPVTLRHTPTVAGEWRLTVIADPMEGETLTGNNETSAFVNVREGGLRVLYLVGATRVGGAPGVEQRFVRASLAASPDLVVDRVVFDYRQPQQGLPPALRPGAIDVVVLDNLDSDALSRPAWQALTELVQDGAGLAVLGGTHSFGAGGYRSIPLESVLPVEVGRAERQLFGEPIRDDVHVKGPLRMVPSAPLGTNHPVMRLGSRDEWSKLPPLDGANRLDRDRLKPNAALLAEAEGSGAPLVVAGQPGLGRVLAIAGDSTWRWVLEGHDDAHRRFWRQAVLWLAKKEDTNDRPVYVELSGRRVQPGARLDATLGVNLPQRVGANNDDPQRAATIRYEARVVGPDGAARPLAVDGGRVRSTASVRETQAPGEYAVEVRALKGDTPLGEARARFVVPRVDLELDRPGAEPETLAQLADATSAAGGRVLAPEELPTLLEELARRDPDQKQEVVSRYTPWDTWPFFLTLVATLVAEWWLRRKWGMP
ncbi:MAG: glutamine amidotransferase [Lacipirellulaceae bacterium]